MRRLSRCIEAKCACMLKSRTPSHCHFTSISAISLHLWHCAVFIWARACALLISAMEDPLDVNSVHSHTFNVHCNYSTQATPITSGPMTNLLQGFLGDTCYPDPSSNRYQHTQSGLGSEEYLNEHNSAFEAQPELSLPSPPLWLLFEQHRDATPLHHNMQPHNVSGSTTMRTWVSADSAYT